MLVVKVRAPRPPAPWGITTQSLDRELARRLFTTTARETLTEHESTARQAESSQAC
jgi:hypothetical protein